jgi:hypothetical protein
MPGSTSSGSSSGASPKYRIVYTPPGGQLRRFTKAIAHNSNRGNSSRHNSSSSTVLLPDHCSKLPSGHHISFPPVTFPATTAGRWGTLLESAASPSKAPHHELWHPWSINRGANRRVLHHRLAAPTIPPWRRFPHEKKSSGYVLPQRAPRYYSVRFWSIT